MRSTFIVGFPGETEEDFELLLNFLKEAQLDRVGCFKFSPVEGAPATEMAEQVPEEIKEERYHRFMQLQQEISANRLKQKVGKTLEVLVDEIDDEGIIGRSKADAPEVDGLVYIDNISGADVKVGDVIKVSITQSDEYDLWGTC
ncbi:ribosomal protein S12 methylthiotransferase RimO [Rodentibacter pneumotropicus]|uniref:Ribosomal protein S12 methylthiotransferase RimO n=1 Tax=Rodentibacter pneumotropicus TaxID=758 RepID=A0A448MU72_9PAST|nr:ribosomal protein S12 methylthiotransferase RimO [Rodentibacter pneumotropicus]